MPGARSGTKGDGVEEVSDGGAGVSVIRERFKGISSVRVGGWLWALGSKMGALGSNVCRDGRILFKKLDTFTFISMRFDSYLDKILWGETYLSPTDHSSTRSISAALANPNLGLFRTGNPSFLPLPPASRIFSYI